MRRGRSRFTLRLKKPILIDAVRGKIRALIFLIAALCGTMPVSLGQAQGQGGRTPQHKVALVIGNANYKEGRLAVAASDARAMASALRQIGFDVSSIENVSQKDLQTALSSFRQKVTAANLVMIYFSGYGIQVARRNYILPVDAELSSAFDVRTKGVSVQDLLDKLPVGPAGTRVLILEASRNNPAEQRFRGFSAGLAATEAPPSTVLVHAAGPNKTVPESTGPSSVFTRHLTEALRTPGATFETIWEQVREQVERATRGEQVPWQASAAPLGFVPGTAPAPPSANVAREPPSANVAREPPPANVAREPPAGTSPDAFELAFWESVRESKNPADYRAYLQAFPNGRFAPLARLRAGGEPATSPPAGVDTRGPEKSTTAEMRPPAPAGAGVTVNRFRDCSDCPEMIQIPPGSFQMGSNEHLMFERPRHAVTIARPFAIGRREVTFEEWDACVAAGACSYRPQDRGWGRGTRPVINVSWDDAQQFIAWLTARTGQKYRLPTEAEWEYAARAGTSTPFWWGKDAGTNRANCTGCGGTFNGESAPAGSFPESPFGIVDMAGNAAEWVEDCWHDSYRGAPADGTAWTSSQCRERVLRGGSFANDANSARTTARFKYDADVRYYANGFRVARDLP
jgi:formylglycine-generating enzyme required for sulfatase activity